MNFIIGLGVAILWMLILSFVIWVLFIKTHLWILISIIAIFIWLFQFISEIIDIGKNTRKLIKEIIKNAKVK